MSESNNKNLFHRFWDTLKCHKNKFSTLTLTLVFLAGIISWISFDSALEYTNTMEFCISCHEMRNNVFKEYQETIHYNNRSGVRTSCADCHVPKDWPHKIARKIQASSELYGKLLGVIDTPEKFEAKRHEMAVNVWRRMKTTDSLECRNCHDVDAMSKDSQSKRAWRRHQKGIKNGKTCIDCHFGIAHKEPEGLGPQDIDFSK